MYPRFAFAIVENRKDLKLNFSMTHAGTLDAFREWVRRSGRAEFPDFYLFGTEDFVASQQYPFAKLRDIGRNSGGVDVIGYFNAELGVGEAGRLLVQALKESEVSVRTSACKTETSRNYHEFETDNCVENHVAILAVNADQVRPVLTDLGPGFFRGRRIIGQWFWELSQPPREYESALELVHEVWAPTKFIRQSIESLNSQRVEVIHMPLPFVVPDIDETKIKSDFGLPDKYVFLFTFDFLSVMKRKNPLGLIESFKNAFQPNEGPVLVLKTINGSQRLKDLESLKWACRGRTDIIIIDQYFTKLETSTLMSLADSYVSLHRSEGLGLTLAESMLLGKPVIATAYSGNMDFMNSDNSYLVDWQEVAVGKGAEGYPTTFTWADPDIDHASRLMKYVYENQAEAAKLGQNAKEYLEREYSLSVCGERMKNRLSKFWK
jgi:glycosyltransferase involved in cell wall biosynthesis